MDQKPGWRFAVGPRGMLRIDTEGFDDDSNGSISSPRGVLEPRVWQHVAAVIHRGSEDSRLYLNGYPIAKGKIGRVNLNDPAAELRIGRISYGGYFNGQLDDVRLYTRALGEAELQALVEPGRAFAGAPPETPQSVTLDLGGRPFSGELDHSSLAAVRLEPGELRIAASHTGVRDLDRLVLTRLDADDPIVKRFEAFAKRTPRLGVHVGLRRDCGSTFAPVGDSQTISSEKLQQYKFEGVISNYPSPDVEKDNVNYLAGVREIAVRSEYTDGRDMPRLLIKSVEFEGPFYDEWPPPSHRNIFIASQHKDDAEAYAHQIIRSFATRAYRRPISDLEETALMGVYRQSLDAGSDFQASVKDALQVALTSPQFLFLVESSTTPQAEPLSDSELASKLSYFLWNEPPDQTTLKLAAEGTLRDKLDAEVTRMIADPRFSQFVSQFAAQWLNLEKFDVLEPDHERFPDLTHFTRAQLRREPIEFVQYLIRNNMPVRNLVESDFIMANEVTARYYGLAHKTESGFKFVPIKLDNPELGGVFGEAAIMAGLSDGRESNPVKRGAWLARKIIAEPPDPPPPNVPNLSADTKGLTLRQRLEQHRNVPACLQCHSKIDPWGVALEEFGADGRLKQQPADAQSTLPDGAKVSGVVDLKKHLGEERIDQVAFSVLEHLATYASGRSLTYYEQHSLKTEELALKPDGYRMQDMVRFVVHSDMFLKK